MFLTFRMVKFWLQMCLKGNKNVLHKDLDSLGIFIICSPGISQLSGQLSPACMGGRLPSGLAEVGGSAAQSGLCVRLSHD